MADEAAMRVYLRDVIQVADATPANARRVAIQNEGLRVITDFQEFDDDVRIKTLCASVRKPGWGQERWLYHMSLGRTQFLPQFNHLLTILTESLPLITLL